MNTQLIPVVASFVGNQTVNTVDARTLYVFLEVRRDFSTWIKSRIEEYGFEEDKDFRSFLGSEDKDRSPNWGSKGGQNRIDYALTLDMAKELAMVERTAKGKQARQYFIECERLALLGGQDIAAAKQQINQWREFSLLAKLKKYRAKGASVAQFFHRFQEFSGLSMDERQVFAYELVRQKKIIFLKRNFFDKTLGFVTEVIFCVHGFYFPELIKTYQKIMPLSVLTLAMSNSARSMLALTSEPHEGAAP
jgi:phage anti-repressor protein